MSAERFKVVDTNPNTAGKGCLCSEVEVTDAEGPFVVFYTHDMASNISPHPVLCKGCLDAAYREVNEGEVLAGGEKDPQPIEIPEEDIEEIDPEHEIDDPEEFADPVPADEEPIPTL